MTHTASPRPVTLSGVHKSFTQGENTVRALDGVDLTVEEGEFVAIMGASGSGKSTLLHALAGLTTIDKGSIEVRGQSLANLSDTELTRFRRNEIGLVFQAFNLIPTLTAVANVELPLMGTSGSAEKAAALLEKFDLSQRAHHKPDALSGGEQQRVAIARALVNDPAILLADEPTGSLDSANGQHLCRLLRALCDDENRSIVVVTHEARVAMWADRVIVLKDGRKQAEFRPTNRDENTGAQELARQYQQALTNSPQGTQPETEVSA